MQRALYKYIADMYIPALHKMRELLQTLPPGASWFINGIHQLQNEVRSGRKRSANVLPRMITNGILQGHLSLINRHRHQKRVEGGPRII